MVSERARMFFEGSTAGQTVDCFLRGHIWDAGYWVPFGSGIFGLGVLWVAILMEETEANKLRFGM